MKLPRAVPEGHFEQFFAPLVGDEAHADAFRERLVDKLETPDDAATNPYTKLEKGVLEVIRETATGHLDDEVKGKELRNWQRLEVNAELGSRTVVAGLRAVGNIYETEAEVPQTLSTVQQSTSRVLKHIYGAAFAGKMVGAVNLTALMRGRNPRRPWTFLLVKEASLAPPGAHRRSFSVETDAKGQLDIRPRYRHLGRVLDRRCPATHARVERGGRRRSALLAFMNTVSAVAIEEIFPEQFEIEHESGLIEVAES
ncbi:MAG TPA: hypothetical protein VFW77_03985 [Candidatus Saccharimonadales bacterium]|nr:hypothetical protein [Candidatus Saccharimonadales bacterium]